MLIFFEINFKFNLLINRKNSPNTNTKYGKFIVAVYVINNNFLTQCCVRRLIFELQNVTDFKLYIKT